ncbi:glycosyltransferase family 2 protein [Aequorivita sp. F47161]|uniref:Glycosyltransferase family 2 protein n=1 Tax=Aequorivita vitellina TaxID=2874475 RepID=A0A9X1QZH5_9FLAO|nr:glycosyltransferase family 2 protein [Aequorivita vitellina]MCG2420247.1 glycosyltransferase family 2 protein [Aequorivita vitellina]
MDVAVIVINYNSSKYTLECINTVIEKTSENISYEMIVVDNNSTLSEYKILKDNFPKHKHVSLHRSVINTGFGGGNMYGAQFANADYLLFLNNDAMLLNNCLDILLNFMKSHPKVGVCTAQNFDENHKFVPSFDHNKGMRRLLLGRGFLEKNNPKLYPKRKFEYSQPLQVNWVNGAFLFFDSKAFAKVGGFDTNIFLYWEEMDICHRLKQAGYETWLVPQAQILHHQGVSTGVSKAIAKESYISYLYVLRKNFGFAKYVFIRMYLAVVLSLKPKKWYLLPIILKSNNQTQSLKLKQKITFLDENRN